MYLGNITRIQSESNICNGFLSKSYSEAASKQVLTFPWITDIHRFAITYKM